MNGLLYLLQVNLYLLFFYLFYLVLLRNETFFKLNRFYLVGSALLALVIPLLKAEWIKDFFITGQIYESTQKVSNMVVSVPLISGTVYSDVYSDHVQNEGLNANQIFWSAYGSITLLLLLNFLRKLYLVNQAFKKGSVHQAFSFFNKVLIDEKLQGRATIVDHEMVHVRQWHSADVIFFELFLAMNWFNPFAYFYRNTIKNIHEFIADDSAASALEDRSAYALLLVSNVFNTQPQQLTNNFFNQSLLKRRIIMLHKTKSRKVAVLKYGLSVPLFAGMLIFSSATIEKSETMKNITTKIEKSIPAVVGAITNEMAVVEKDPYVKEHVSPTQKALSTKSGTIITEAEDPALRSLVNHFNKLLRYSPSDQEDKLEGITFVSFELDKAGAIQNPSVIRAISAGSYSDVIRVVKLAKPFGEGLSGKYLLSVKYSLGTELNTTPLPSHDYTKDSIDRDKFKAYKELNGVHIRGYLPSAKIKEIDQLNDLRAYFSRSVKYPDSDMQNGISGANFVAFELDSAGIIQNTSFIKAMSGLAQEEIMRVIKLAQPFGRDAAGKYILPIMFVLNKPIETTKDPLVWSKFSNYKRLKSVIIPGTGSAVTGAPNPNYPLTEGPQNFTYTTSDETKGEAGKIVNYIKVDYLIKPIILVDGKETGYKVTDKGFKLDNTIYPKHADIKIYTREAAVKNFNERARDKGLIVITTGPEKE